MALLIRGATSCPICGKVIEEGEDAVLFNHFVMNESDELFRFSDSACHSTCFQNHPLGPALVVAFEDYVNRTGPGHRHCAVCANEIMDPNDYLLIGYLGEPSKSRLAGFNFTHLHRSHISLWSEAERFLRLAKEALASGSWKGPQLPNLIEAIEAARLEGG